MWRTRAVLTLLQDDVAGLGLDPEATAEERAEAMARARRRAAMVIALDWIAILVLVLLGDRALPQLTIGPSQQTAFTLAILAVAAHSGFRLGQLEKLRAVGRAAQRLTRRDPAS